MIRNASTQSTFLGILLFNQISKVNKAQPKTTKEAAYALSLDEVGRKRGIQPITRFERWNSHQNWNRRPASISRGAAALVIFPKLGDVKTPDGEL